MKRPLRLDFNFQNHTGHVLTEHGLFMLLEAVRDLHILGTDSKIVRGVPCMKGIRIDVVVTHHGMATKR